MSADRPLERAGEGESPFSAHQSFDALSKLTHIVSTAALRGRWPHSLHKWREQSRGKWPCPRSHSKWQSEDPPRGYRNRDCVCMMLPLNELVCFPSKSIRQITERMGPRECVGSCAKARSHEMETWGMLQSFLLYLCDGWRCFGVNYVSFRSFIHPFTHSFIKSYTQASFFILTGKGSR